jgi:hypothetical protein
VLVFNSEEAGRIDNDKTMFDGLFNKQIKEKLQSAELKNFVLSV